VPVVPREEVRVSKKKRNPHRPTDADLDAAAEFVRWATAAMNLHWRILIKRATRLNSEFNGKAEEDSEVLASITPHYGKRDATLHLGAEWRRLDTKTQAECLTHELTHLILSDVADVYRLGGTILPQKAYDVLETWGRQKVELATDHIALMLCEILPAAEVLERFKKEHGA
jgi:hypothetical protein